MIRGRLGGVHRSVNMARDNDNEEKNAYEVVGVGPDATDADIKKAFRQRSLKTHPDRVRRVFVVACSLLRFPSHSEPPSQRCRYLHLSKPNATSSLTVRSH
jgi:DnaJ domain